jgi:GrpB-like predicted nucleotidyltransferase (UPF0157 family)
VFESHSRESALLIIAEYHPAETHALAHGSRFAEALRRPMSSTLTIEPNRESWRRDFESEATLIPAELGLAFKDVHHIGSTAVPGIHAEPISDMLTELESLESIDAHRTGMELLGYEVMGEFGIPDRRYFRKDNSFRASDASNPCRCFRIAASR